MRAELRRRERLLAEAAVQDVDDYARTLRGRGEPLPRLVVVVDELRTLVDEVPEFVSGLVRLAAQGRSLGIHLVLATQRPAGAVTAEVQANVSLRIAFRVRDRSDSVAIVEDGAAADIRPQTPGRAVVRGADGRLRTFQSAMLGAAPRSPDPGSWLEVLGVEDRGAVGARPAEPGTAALAPRDPAGGSCDLVTAIAAAHRITGAADPRPPWLPALPDRLPLGLAARPDPAGPEVGDTAVLGLVDEPDLQRIGPLTWRPESGTWLLPGRPGSGRTSALRALVASAAAVHGPSALHLHVLDPTSCLPDVAALPHVGTHVSGADGRALAALLDHLRGVVAARRAARPTTRRMPDAVEPAVLVVVDGWEQLVEAHSSSVGADVTEDLVRVLRDGAAVGVVGAVAGGRALFQPRWAGLGGCTVLLGAPDPLDVALAGLRASDVPKNPPPGRGIRLKDRREVQFALVESEDLRVPASARAPRAGGAWRHRPLPDRVALPAHPLVGVTEGSGLPSRPAERTGPHRGRHPLGVFGEAHEVWCWDPEVHGRVLLVAGPGRSGRTNVLHVIATSVVVMGRPVVLVTRASPVAIDRGAGLPGATGGAGGSGTLSVISPRDVDLLVAARRRDPRLAVLVDDADLLEGEPVAGVLLEVLDLVDRDDGLVVAATTTSRLATRFRGLDVAVSRRRAGLLLQPGPGDGDLLGAPPPHGIPATAGRGLFVGGGAATEVQVYLADASAGRSLVGVDTRDAALGGRDLQRSHGGHRGEAEDQPAGKGLVALDEPQGDGHEQCAPHDGRRPGPVGTADPAPGEHRQTDPADEDEQRRHEHPSRVAALADDELVDVEGREAHERRGLESREDGDEAARAG